MIEDVPHETSYDEVAYPSTVFQQTHPERLFAMAWLHGLEPPPVDTARILEIGGGDGMNVISIATAYPRTRALSFDLSARAVARGQAVIRDADLTNVKVEVGDILEAAESMEGTFDYVVCHGVYAWVPEVVRDAILKLVGRVLAPNGVAYISYNAMPGGHLRIAIREMLLRHVGHIADPAERIATAQAFLDEYGKAQDNEPRRPGHHARNGARYPLQARQRPLSRTNWAKSSRRRRSPTSPRRRRGTACIT
ncbi:MAG: class I SAM-dependent methyltransferase [Asticcacaulis sp.]